MKSIKQRGTIYYWNTYNKVENLKIYLDDNK